MPATPPNTCLLDGGKTVPGLFQRLELEQPFTAQHSLRTCQLALDIAARLKIVDKEELTFLQWGTLLHDFGKLYLPITLLLKAEELTLKDYELLTTHVKLGCTALKDYLPQEALDIVLYHHERFDGAGYPSERKGHEVPLLAKICAVAGAFDAMTDATPYRGGMTVDEAADEIFWNSGTQFDPVVVKAFMECYNSWTRKGCG